MDERIEQFPPYRKAETHGHDDHGHDDQGHAHAHPGFWSTYIFSPDHKVIGIQYGVTALSFLYFGLMLMLMMRWQIAHPGKAVPLIGWLIEKIFGQQMAPGGVIS